MLSIHKAGKNTTVYAVILFIALAIATFLFTNIYLILALITSGLWMGFCLNFFRNPDRPIPDPNKAQVNCPADGEVVVIEKTFESEVLNKEMWQISIFMSPLNVHVNRSPISGIISYFKYHKGKFLVAWHPKSSTDNERTTIVIDHQSGQRILVRQIAGAVARRIIAYIQPEQQVESGEEIGFIRFGSRVDVFLPLDANIMVKKGQKVFGNKDVLAQLAISTSDL
ncbi:phosphatidylserine decarboxylase family protein [Membranihabitans marinus]|uniref:phosphatidylserine decarboxylase family protein n=1 Tax=Membranihabitans marinus TaxID=1227546 RepID=UPI001F00604B|nr:phosphatidylserine decarboxylase family protein [Membranihabitans marinus]